MDGQRKGGVEKTKTWKTTEMENGHRSGRNRWTGRKETQRKRKKEIS